MTAAPRFSGRLSALSPDDRATLLARARREVDRTVSERVARIAEAIVSEGDAALLRLTRELDGVELAALEVDPARVLAARDALDPALRAALERTKRNLERVHRAFLPAPVEVSSEPGVRVGRRPEPLAAVGVYAPGGRAAYPSSVLMGVVPARVAGVREVVVCSPPQKNGLPSDVVLAAAAIAGAHRVFALGGAQAIAALAHGTASVPRVDRIVGPGNAYVAEAKRQVAGFVGIDAPAGPSEILILADETADPQLIAREMIAQAEHDPEASCVALISDAGVYERATAALAASPAGRSEIVDAALSSRSALLLIDTLEEGYAFAAEYAGEHVLLAVRDPHAVLPHVRHAGTVFFGGGASVAFGDYLTGANHVLPTAGAGRSFSGLSTLDFMRFTTWQEVSRDAARRMADDVGLMADSEGLPGHAAAARAYQAAAPAEVARPARRATPRASYREMRVYSSNRRPVAIDLTDNTNQLGAPPGARALLLAESAGMLSRYPSHYADELKAAAAARYGVTPEEIVTGCGSDDVIDSSIRAFTEPGDIVAFPDPTFAMLPYFAHMNGATPVAVPLLGPEQGYDVDLDAMLALSPRVLYLCSPNNPTGTLVRPATIERALAEAPSLVVLDEAYVEYAGASLAKRAREEGRLLVVRTLSKAFGLAGQRVGVAIGAPELVAEIEKSRGPYKVSNLGEAMAAKALREDGAWVDAGVRDVLAARTRFVAWLEARGLHPLPSSANFVLVPVKDAADAATRLRERGIGVRPFPRLSRFGDALRISIGPWSLMEQVLEPLAEVLCG